MKKIVLASSNIGKIKEFKELLKNFAIEVIPQSELKVKEVEETGFSFIENALIKARHASKKTGLSAIADDSGLTVGSLHGAPGIYSARYAGTPFNSHKNIQKLLYDLKDVPDDKRQASFYCALAFLSEAEDPIPLVCTGIWRGSILREPRGEHGFGYDPIFFVPYYYKTAAELPIAIKNTISHRAIALQSLLTLLPEKL